MAFPFPHAPTLFLDMKKFDKRAIINLQKTKNDWQKHDINLGPKLM